MKKGLAIVMMALVGASTGAIASGEPRPGQAGMDQLRRATLEQMNLQLRQELPGQLRRDLDVAMLASRRITLADRSGTSRPGAPAGP